MMRRASLVSLALVLFSTVLLCSVANAQPSIVLLSGKVFTGDPARPYAEAIAIDGERIAAVGTNDEIRAMATSRTRVIELGGRLVIPGINDAHMHPGFATPVFRLEPSMNPTRAAMEAAIHNAVEETTADTWIVMTIGPTVLLDPEINADSLETFAEGRKVVLNAFTGHGAILSHTAMADLGIARDAKDPVGGWYGRDAEGMVDGRAFEYAQYPFERRIADMATDSELLEDVQSWSDELLGYGITSAQVMPWGSEPRFINALARAKSPVRVRVIDLLDHADTKTDAVKWLLDGTPIELNAALRNGKYAAGGKGRLNFSDFPAKARAAAVSKRQLLVHASGDLAVETALKAFAENPTLVRPRIEHGDGLHRDLFPLAKQTGAVIVQNPSHFEARQLFPQGNDYQIVKSIVQAGIPFAIGSDGLTNPYINILLATMNGDESLTREEALRAYTSGSAFAEMKEREKGTIAKGMLADLAVLSQDIFEVPPPALPETRSVLTIVGGKIAYSRM
jgi:predicted amidohydrolase YtcJ